MPEDTPPQTRAADVRPVAGQEMRPFVGRSRDFVSAEPQDLLAPVGESWEVDADL